MYLDVVSINIVLVASVASWGEQVNSGELIYIQSERVIKS